MEPLEEHQLYDKTMVSLHRRRDFRSLPEFLKQVRDLESAESCIAVGGGAGKYEEFFIRHCLPKLKHITVVDPNSKSSEKFESLIKTEFSELGYEFKTMQAQDWSGPEQQVDVILAIHVLYHIQGADRVKLFENCLQKWLKPTGKMVILLWEETTFCTMLMAKLWPEVRHQITSAQSVAAELESLGYIIEKVYHYETTIDLTDLDDDFLRIFQYDLPWIKVDFEYLKDAIRSFGIDKGKEIYGVLVVSALSTLS